MYHADSHGARPQPSIICGLDLARRCALPPYPRPSSPRPDAAGACCVSCPLGAGAGALSARSVSPLRRRICHSTPDGAAGDGATGVPSLCAVGVRRAQTADCGRIWCARARPTPLRTAGLRGLQRQTTAFGFRESRAFANSFFETTAFGFRKSCFRK